MKLGAMTNCFRKPFRESLEMCSKLGVDGVQIWATNMTHYWPDHILGELDPDTFTESIRQDLLATLKRLGLEISALCGDLGRGFVNAEHVEEDVKKARRMMDMAKALGVTVLTTHIGKVAEDPYDPTMKSLRWAMEEIGAYGEKLEIYFATETGPESGKTLNRFIESLDSKALKANYDPANLVMGGFDPLQGVYDLRNHIVHTHAKDGIGPKNPPVQEVTLGDGEVPWLAYIKALKEIGYNGYLTIEREVGENPSADILTALNFLREKIKYL